MFHAEHGYSTVYVNVHQNIEQMTKEMASVGQTHFHLELNDLKKKTQIKEF